MIGKILYIDPEDDHGLVDAKDNDLGILTIYFKNSEEKQKIEKNRIVELEVKESKKTGKIYAKFISLANDTKTAADKDYEKQLLEKKTKYYGFFLQPRDDFSC